jgi:hypothetical protein
MKRFVPTALFSCRCSFSLHPIPQKIPEQMDSAGKKSMSLYAGIEHVTALANTEVGRSK